MGGPMGSLPPWQQRMNVPPFMQHPPSMGGPHTSMPPSTMNPTMTNSAQIPPSSMGPKPLMMVPQEPTGMLKEEEDLEKEEDEVNQKIRDSENNLHQQEEVTTRSGTGCKKTEAAFPCSNGNPKCLKPTNILFPHPFVYLLRL